MKAKLLVVLVCLLMAAWSVGATTVDMTVTVGNAAPTVDSVAITPDDDVGTSDVQVDPVADSTKTITVTAYISDVNGWDTINASADFTTGSPTNGVSIGAMSCVTVDSDTAVCTATYDMQFYDPAQNYVVTVTGDDGTTTDTGTGSFDYTSQTAMDIDATAIAFPGVNAGATSTVTGDTDIGTPDLPTVRNIGNAELDTMMSGTDLTGAGTVTVDKVKYQYSTSGFTVLSGTPALADIDLAAGSMSTIDLDFELNVPIGTAAGSYSGTVTVTAS